MTPDQYLAKVGELRNKVCGLLQEAEALAKAGEDIKGEYISVDFDGDKHDDHESLGEAFGMTSELENVATALFHFIECGGKEEEVEEQP